MTESDTTLPSRLPGLLTVVFRGAGAAAPHQLCQVSLAPCFLFVVVEGEESQTAKDAIQTHV
jgi:hypothetical protein